MFKKQKYLAFIVAASMSAASFMVPLPVSAAAAMDVSAVSATLTPVNTTVAAGQAAQVRVTTTVGVNSVVASYDNTNAAGVMQSSTAASKEWVVQFNPSVTQVVTFQVSSSADPNGGGLTATYYLPVTVTGGAAVTLPGTLPGTSAAGTAFDPNSYNPNGFNPNVYNPSDYNSYRPSTPVPSTPTPTPTADIAINDISETSSGRTVTLTVEAGDDVNNVWVNFDRQQVDGGRYIQGTRSGDNTWVVSFNPADTEQIDADVQTVIVSANTAYKTNGAETEEYDIAFTSSIVVPEPVITGVSATRTTLYENQNTVLSISTNADADNVWVKYDSSKTVNAVLQTGSTATTKRWTATLTPTSTQTLVVYANIGSGEEGAATRNYAVTVTKEEEYGDRATISSVNADWEDNNYSNGDSADIHVEVTTNSYANYVWFRYDGRDYNLTRASSSSNRWTTASGGRNVDYDRNEDTIVVYVSERSRTSYDDSETVDIDGHRSSSSGDDDEILEADPDDGEDVDADRYLDVEVRTGADVEWVRIVRGTDPNDDEESDDNSPSTSSGDHIFDLEVDTRDLDDDTSITFTIYAYTDDNDDEDDYSDSMRLRLYAN